MIQISEAAYLHAVKEGAKEAHLEYLERNPGAFEASERIRHEMEHELLAPEDAARMLTCSVVTLAKNHKKWGLTKSVALGPTNPRYFRSQILTRMHAIAIVPRSTSPTSLRDVSRKGVVAA